MAQLVVKEANINMFFVTKRNTGWQKNNCPIIFFIYIYYWSKQRIF